MNALTFDINGKMAEMYKQNAKVVQYMLMMFVGMDFITRLYDESADMFKAVTVGIKAVGVDEVGVRIQRLCLRVHHIDDGFLR